VEFGPSHFKYFKKLYFLIKILYPNIFLGFVCKFGGMGREGFEEMRLEGKIEKYFKNFKRMFF